MIKLITFDVTRTLLQLKSSVGVQYAEALKKFARITCNPKILENSFLKAFKSHSKTFPMFGKMDGLSNRAWWKSVFYETLLLSGSLESSSAKRFNSCNKQLTLPLFSDKSFVQIEGAFDSLYNHFEYDAMPYAHELLKFLNQRKPQVVVGIITNSDDRVHKSLQLAGLNSYIDFIVTSSMCGFQKPDKRIFDFALRIASSKCDAPILPSCSLHIGDTLNKDYEGAIAAGFLSLLLDPNKTYLNKINPDHRINNLSCIMEKFDQL